MIPQKYSFNIYDQRMKDLQKRIYARYLEIILIPTPHLSTKTVPGFVMTEIINESATFQQGKFHGCETVYLKIQRYVC